MVVAFEGFELDLSTYELRRGGTVIPVEPQVFEVLKYLVVNRDRVVPKEELLDEIWGSRFVSESALTSRIKSARRALGDDGRAQRMIKTVHGRGYRFAVAIDEERSRADDAGERGASTTAMRDESPPTNLPTERTPLLGRGDDVAAITDALRRHRLVTLLGIGGTGKTRLAIAAAQSAIDRFADGVWFVDLVPVDTEEGVALAIADAARLGLGEDDSIRGQIATLVADRDALFVIDNAEHIAEEVSQVLDGLLDATSAPHFLVTSRVPLGLHDECHIAVTPLAVGSDHATSPAVDLLVTAARRFGADVGDDPAVLWRICQHLDGLPLAIELAAAQLRYLDPVALVERLDRRFEVLTGTARARRERHSSLEGVLADTWATIDPDELELLRRMAAFPSSFTLHDLTEVTRVASANWATVEPSLRELVDRSLVVREPGPATRYRLLETVKLYTRQTSTASQRQQVDDEHADWCLTSVGSDPAADLFDLGLADWCFDHHDDLRAATRHLTERNLSNEAARLTVAATLAVHADVGSRAAELLQRVEGHLASGAGDALAARLHLTAVMCGMAMRSPRTIASHGQEALACAERDGDPFLRTVARVLRSWSVVFSNADDAIALTQQAAEIADEAGDASCRDLADGYRAFHLAMQRRYDEASALARSVVDRSDGRRNHPTYVGLVAFTSIICLSDPAEALRHVDELGATPHRRNAMWASDLLAASIHAANGMSAEAVAITGSIRDRLRQSGQEGLPDLLIPPAVLAYQRGELDRARRWVASVRAAQRPTQSFQATILYRRLRDHVGGFREDALVTRSLDEVGAEALDWLCAQA